MKKMSRREAMKTAAAGAAAAWTASACRSLALGAAKQTIPLGLELWSVRHLCEDDLPGVLAAVAQMGYEGVEFAHSYYGHDAKSLRKLLDSTGLKSCGMHTSLPNLQGDQLKETIDIHALLETPYIILASLPKKNLASEAAIKRTAELVNGLAEELKPHGMKIGYHCHGGDFAAVDGSTPWELIGRYTRDDVVMQLDVGNCIGGGGDPIAMLNQFPGRTLSIHLKEHGGGPDAVFGEGDVDWAEVFRLCETIGGTTWYVIEEEGRQGTAALLAVQRAIRNFRKMRA